MRCAREFRATCAQLLTHLRQAAAAGRLDKHIGAALLSVRDATGGLGNRQVLLLAPCLYSNLTLRHAQASHCRMRA